jgi:hypothetical protein
MVSSSHAEEDNETERPFHAIFRDIVIAVKADEVLSKSSPQSTSPNMEVKAIDEDKHDPKLAKRLHILHLPPETLLQIALNLCGTNAILALSKTNKYIHRITNEAMAKKLVVRPPHMKGPLDWLAHHPHIMGCVNTVDVSAFQQILTKLAQTSLL